MAPVPCLANRQCADAQCMRPVCTRFDLQTCRINGRKVPKIFAKPIFQWEADGRMGGPAAKKEPERDEETGICDVL